MAKSLITIALCLFLSSAGQAATFDLRFERLAEALAGLKESDRGVVQRAVESIKRGENTLALTQLSALNRSYPMNSSLRILTAFALLQTGNLLGAFDEARKAESAPGGNSYKCWFLAKVAFIAGDNVVCKRELEHARGDKAASEDVRALEREMNRK